MRAGSGPGEAADLNKPVGAVQTRALPAVCSGPYCSLRDQSRVRDCGRVAENTENSCERQDFCLGGGDLRSQQPLPSCLLQWLLMAIFATAALINYVLSP